VDIKELSQLNKKGGPTRQLDNSYIRTMEKDLAVLQGKGPVKSVLPTGDSTEKRSVGKLVPPKPPTESFRKATPPAGLPVLESVKGPETSLDALSVPRPTESIIPPKSPERIIKEEEIKNRIKETQRRIEEARRKAEMARQKAAREEAEKKETPRKIETAKKKKPSLSFVFIGLAAIVVIGGLGGFVYWWNYLRVITPVFHYECQDNLCQRVEKKGEDQCQIDADCQLMPVEPTVPASLMPVAEIKTIELTAGQEDLLLEELKTAASQEQAANTFKQILVKIVGPEEKKYASLNSLSNALGISLPENILLAVAASETEGDNYTLFLYNQTEGNRLGLVVKMAQSETLVADLKNWEATMTGGLKSLFLENEAPAAFTEGFQDNIYQDIVIRYLNFPDPGLSIDYGIVTGKLILTTSRESMYAAIDALLTVESETENEPESEPESKTEIEDCGISESFLNISLDQINPEEDKALVCLGKKMLAGCEKAKAVLKTFNAGEINFILEGPVEEGVCSIRSEYGDEEQIPLPEQKQYAGTYIRCPVNIELIKSQAPEKDPNEEPGAFALSVDFYRSWLRKRNGL